MEKINTRREKILASLKASNVLSITALADMHKVSAMTIRRDLEFLAEQGAVQFYHGGAVINPQFFEKDTNPNNYYLQQQTMLHREEKTLIAKKAAGLLLPQETIMLDSGTSIYYLAKELPGSHNLTVISWSLNVIEELIRKPQNKILIQGGIYHPETQMFENNQGLDIIKNCRASRAFISAGGVHLNLGITTPFHYEIETKRAAVKCSMTSILLIDSFKFGKVCSTYMADIRDFQVILTDSGIPPEYKEFILNSGVELIIA
jgi:DeoR family deoxyribose operon repressor